MEKVKDNQEMGMFQFWIAARGFWITKNTKDDNSMGCCNTRDARSATRIPHPEPPTSSTLIFKL
jgi:hypothetical protein